MKIIVDTMLPSEWFGRLAEHELIPDTALYGESLDCGDTAATKVSEAEVLTTNFYGGRDSSTGATSGPFVIVMGSKAVFVVKETAKLESGRGDEDGFGIFGPTSGEYAVFQAKNIVRDSYLESINSHGAVTYGGNL